MNEEPNGNVPLTSRVCELLSEHIDTIAKSQVLLFPLVV